MILWIMSSIEVFTLPSAPENPWGVSFHGRDTMSTFVPHSDLERGSGRSRILHQMMDEVLKTHVFLETRPAWASMPMDAPLYVAEALLHPGCGSWVRLMCEEPLAERLAQRLFCDRTGSPRLRHGRALGILTGYVARAFTRSFDEHYHYIPPRFELLPAGIYEPRMLATVVVEGGGILLCDHNIHPKLWPHL